jgi:hypothetical protein
MGIKVVKRKVKLTPTQRAVMGAPSPPKRFPGPPPVVAAPPPRARFPGPPPRAVIPTAPPRAGQNPLMGAVGPGFFGKKYHPNSKGRNIR